MSAPFSWDPDRYLAFSDERGRPFADLVARIGAEDPRTVVDLGCGTGNLTVLLAQRWPGARVLGVDSSEEMVRAAPSDAGVEFTVGDIREWSGSATRPGRRRTRLQRRAAVGPRTPRPPARAGPRGRSRRLARPPGPRQLRRAEPHHSPRAGRRPGVRRSHRGCGCAGRPRRRDLSARAPRPRLPGGCLGDDLPARARGSGPGLQLGERHRRPADAGGAAARPASGLRGGVQGPASRGLPREGGRGRAAVPPGLRGRARRVQWWCRSPAGGSAMSGRLAT